MNDDRELLIEKSVKDFGAVLHEFRVKNNLTLQDMAEITGVSSSYVWRIEQNRRKPELEMRLNFMIQAMGWSTEDVYLYLDKYIAKTRSQVNLD